MKTITLTQDSQVDRLEPSHDTHDGEDLLSLFNQYSDLISQNSDYIATKDAIIINEVLVKGIIATYHITVQQCTTTPLINTGANMSVIS